MGRVKGRVEMGKGGCLGGVYLREEREKAANTTQDDKTTFSGGCRGRGEEGHLWRV